MKEVHEVDDIRTARVLLNPIRVALLERLRESSNCAELADFFGVSKQRMNNHLKELLDAGLVEVVAETARRNLIEKTYRAVAKLYWLSPRLGRANSKDIRSIQQKLSLHNLLAMAERLHEDAAALLDTDGSAAVHSIGVTAEIRLRSAAERESFTQDYLRLMHGLLEKYQHPTEPDEHSFTAMLVCYPSVADTYEQNR